MQLVPPARDSQPWITQKLRNGDYTRSQLDVVLPNAYCVLRVCRQAQQRTPAQYWYTEWLPQAGCSSLEAVGAKLRLPQPGCAALDGACHMCEREEEFRAAQA